MKKIFVIAAFAVAISLTASFGSGRIEIRARPSYDQHRDQQWRDSQQNQQREQEQRDRLQREQWQRGQWQREQHQRSQRHQMMLSYELWLPQHQHDYDNRR
ncbi:MAG: hypothetical protein ABSG63_01160 [Spirochaetia bacterium]|jgi:hypothetical protein